MADQHYYGTGESRSPDASAGRDCYVAGRDIIFGDTRLDVARSAYLEQVRKIAPPELKGRKGELEELERFCIDPDGASYAWWQAGPWAGKSALLSTFVLRPPARVEAAGVRIVSFFITARLARYDTRETFIQVVSEQLAALLGESLPAMLPAAREARLPDLMSQAAHKCQQEEGRLVLVVDGLDEDRGVADGPDAPSIAGLLPPDPQAGMRVIVASRPLPPLPDDVPDWHPLRGTGVIRPLPSSPHAGNIQRLARHELRLLLEHGPAGRDIIGLLAAARGGLTAWDLASLANLERWRAEAILHAGAGRVLTSRPSLLGHPGRSEVYLLGHEELRAAAVYYLGDRLGDYYDRLHAWAEGYRKQGWPPDTPEYLLADYFRLLRDLADLPRMAECASDSARHDRLLSLTGGDALALDETRTTLDLIAGCDAPDLASALILACHRDHLTDRNSRIPVALPAVWAALGQPSRAQALADSITSTSARSIALAKVSGALARAGQHQAAKSTAEHAEGIGRSAADPHVLAQVAGALARAGQHQRAEAIAGSIIDPGAQASAFTQVARAQAQAGRHQQAAALARSIRHPRSKAVALARVAGALALAGRHKDAKAVAGKAEDSAWSMNYRGTQESALVEVAAALAKAGQYQKAKFIARSITYPDCEGSALAEAAGTLARTGQGAEAEALARSIASSDLQASALAEVAEGLALAGQYQKAEALARSITSQGAQARALAEIAGALAQAGRHKDAEAVAGDVEDIVRSRNCRDSQARALAEVTGALALAGQRQKAEALAWSITDPEWQARALAEIAGAPAQAGPPSDAQAGITRSVADLGPQAIVLAGVLAQAGLHRDAHAIARSITDPEWRAGALAEVTRAIADCEQQPPGAITRFMTYLGSEEKIAGALVRTGDHRGQDQVPGIFDGPLTDSQSSPLADAAAALARVGEITIASRAAAASCALEHWTAAARPVFLLLTLTESQLLAGELAER